MFLGSKEVFSVHLERHGKQTTTVKLQQTKQIQIDNLTET
jgi:hypothetical protein